ncbi:MAG: helix-turn-helix domain-containing protein [Phycisphaerae bacterium]
MPSFLASLTEWQDKHIDALRERKTSENLNLDYKRDPYTDESDGRFELLKDITAMANAGGGLIIIGIEEKNGTPVKRVPVAEPEKQRDWIEHVANENIDRPIPGLATSVVGTSVLIRVPMSACPPHMFRHGGKAKGQKRGKAKRGTYFYKRHDRENRLMSLQEIREAVIQTERYGARAEEFLLRRIGCIVQEGNSRACAVAPEGKPSPAAFVTVTPIPLRSGSIDTNSEEAKSIVIGRPFLDALPEGVTPFHPFDERSKPFIYGRQSISERFARESGRIRCAVRLFRNGHLECGRTLHGQDCESVDGRRISYSGPIVLDMIIATARLMREVVRLIGTCSAAAFSIVFTHFLNCTVDQPLPEYLWQERELKLAPPEVDLTFTVDGLADYLRVSHLLCDRLWQCFGKEQCDLVQQRCEFLFGARE